MPIQKKFPCILRMTLLVYLVTTLTLNFVWAAQPYRKAVVDESQYIQVYLNEEISISGDFFNLGDVARLEGTDYRNIEKLNRVQLGKSPLPGSAITVSEANIINKLRNLIKTERLQFAGSSQVKVSRSAMLVAGEDIDQAVIESIAEEGIDESLKPKLLSNSRDVFLPQGELSYQVESKGNYKKEGGYRTYEVSLFVDGKVQKMVSVRVYLKVYKDVYVAKDTIKQDQVITEADLEQVNRNVERLPLNYVTNKSMLVGKMAKRAINPREVMNERSLEVPPVINSGDHLQIIYETDNLRLTAPGIAMSKGGIGERIAVRNMDSKHVLQATIKGKSLVQVN